MFGFHFNLKLNHLRKINAIIETCFEFYKAYASKFLSEFYINVLWSQLTFDIHFSMLLKDLISIV